MCLWESEKKDWVCFIGRVVWKNVFMFFRAVQKGVQSSCIMHFFFCSISKHWTKKIHIQASISRLSLPISVKYFTLSCTPHKYVRTEHAIHILHCTCTRTLIKVGINENWPCLFCKCMLWILLWMLHLCMHFIFIYFLFRHCNVPLH